MSLIEKLDIKCEYCEGIENVFWYKSVNVKIDPKLVIKLKNRKINSFKCSKCGKLNELFSPFLYNDGKKNMIWCYPNEFRENKSEIEEEQLEYNKVLKEEMGVNTKLVFGYDELLKII